MSRRTAAKPFPTGGRFRSTCCQAERARSLRGGTPPAADSSQGADRVGVARVVTSRRRWCSRSFARAVPRCGRTNCRTSLDTTVTGIDGLSSKWSGLTISEARAVVDVQGDDHRCRLRTLIDELIAGADLHGLPSSGYCCADQQILCHVKSRPIPSVALQGERRAFPICSNEIARPRERDERTHARNP